MVNNFDLIIPLLKFDSEDDFYYLQILQRKKENDQIGSNSHVVKNYYIKSTDYLVSHKEEIIKLCEAFNARAMLRLNKRSFEKVAYKALVNYANVISNREFEFCKKAYDRAIGQGHNERVAKWIIDIDNTLVIPILLIEYINKCDPQGDKIVTTIPSKNGLHLIVNPFNRSMFDIAFPDIAVQIDNPTNLFIP
jgi:hypothetical protein